MAVSKKVRDLWNDVEDVASTQEIAELFESYLSGWRGELLQQYMWDYGWMVTR